MLSFFFSKYIVNYIVNNTILYIYYFFFFQILGEISRNKIKIYDFPEYEDEDDNKLQKYLKVCMGLNFTSSKI